MRHRYVPKFEVSVSTNRFLATYSDLDHFGKPKRENDFDNALWENFGEFQGTGRLFFFVVHSDKAPAEVCF